MILLHRRLQEMKQHLAAKEAEEDLERMAQYAKVLEEQERKREEMFRSFMERQEKLGKVRDCFFNVFRLFAASLMLYFPSCA